MTALIIVKDGDEVVDPEYLFVWERLIFVDTPLTTFCQLTDVWAGLADTVQTMVTEEPTVTLYCDWGMVTTGIAIRVDEWMKN